MRRAVRNQRLKDYKEGKRKRLNPLLRVLGCLGLGLLVLVALLGFLIPSRFWDGKSRTALVVKEETDNISMIVLDPVTDTITTFSLPSNVEVEAARQLGTWRLSSLWQLGQDEKVGGSLLSTSLTKSFGLPVEAWGDHVVGGLAKMDFLNVFWGMVAPCQTNLTIKDRVGMGLFALGVKPSGRISIDLKEAGVLRKVTLADGETGYQVRDAIPSRITAAFGDAAVSSEGARVVINYTGANLQEAEEVGQIIQVLGAKVISLLPAKETSEQTLPKEGCLIVGEKSVTRGKIARLFGCLTQSKDGETLQVLLGESFFARY